MTVTVILDAEELFPPPCRKCGEPHTSAYHIMCCSRAPTRPPADLGGNLRTVEDVRQWLGHPSNQFANDVFIVRWDGFVPRIDRLHAARLWEGTGLAEAVIYEQLRRKRGLPDPTEGNAG